MKEQSIDELFRSLRVEIQRFPATRSRACALTKLEETLLWAAVAAAAKDSTFDILDEA